MGRPLGSVNKPKDVVEGEVMVEAPVKVRQVMAPLAKGMKLSDVRIEEGRYYLLDDNHPLCKECSHRQDMHHVWREIEHHGMERDMYGNRRETSWLTKEKKFDVPQLPCQHACKCWDYK